MRYTNCRKEEEFCISCNVGKMDTYEIIMILPVFLSVHKKSIFVKME